MSKRTDETKIYFATDLHGSDTCWKKFVNAGKYYDVDVLILGGDLTGKGIVYCLEQSDGSYKAIFMGKEYNLRTSYETTDFDKKVRMNGFYPFRTTKDDLDRIMQSEEKRSDVFLKLMIEALREWISFAEQKLKDSGIDLYVTAGNDDDPTIDSVLKESDTVVHSDQRLVKIDHSHEMISSSYSNMTPWKCPRDIPEDELEKKIEAMASQVRDMPNCIFNLHVPPINSTLDNAPALDKDLKPKQAGQEITGVGSTAVRKVIEQYQPLLGLHGHIHESKGFSHIGRTLCINPGSTYSEGILQGVVIRLKNNGIENYWPVQG
jgi:Icc-related predicted phosphoesterase